MPNKDGKTKCDEKETAPKKGCCKRKCGKK